jgi:hypothetical protein
LHFAFIAGPALLLMIAIHLRQIKQNFDLL